MGALSTCCRVYIVICNIFFVILGLVFFAGGLFIRFGSSVYDSYIDGVKKDIETSASQSGFGTVDLSDFDLSTVLLGLAIAFIVFGIFVLGISLLGCCGACYKIKVLLIVYVIICSILLIGQIVVIGLVYGSSSTVNDVPILRNNFPFDILGSEYSLCKIKDPIKDNLKDGIQSDYKGLNGTNTVSIGWNVVMQKVECCGVDSYNDFSGATNWITVYTGYTLITPLACCKTLPSSSDYTCATAGGATDATNYLNTGCFDKIWKDTIENKPISIIVLSVIGVFQLILVLFGIILSCQWKNNKTSPSDKQHPSSNHVDRVHSVPPIVEKKRNRNMNF